MPPAEARKAKQVKAIDLEFSMDSGFPGTSVDLES